MPSKNQILNGFQLKMIAIFTMLIDHTAATILYRGILMPHAPLAMDSFYYKLYLVYKVMRGIGRIAFPIFCFFLIEGFRYTHSRLQYAKRLFIFALLSELPFDLAFSGTPWDVSHQNVFWTLLLGIFMLQSYEFLGDEAKKRFQVLSSQPYLAGLCQLLSVALWCFIAFLLKTDYSYRGLILIFVLYVFRYDRLKQMIAGTLAFYWELPAVLPSFLLLFLYNGKRGRGMKYFFYLFYPLHLLLLFLLTVLIHNRI